jgi:hypothetical protein
MISSDFTPRVALETTAIVTALTVPAAWLGGVSAALGVLAGGLLGVGNFCWLSGQARAACEAVTGAARRDGWMLLSTLRLFVTTAACAILLVTGWIHPVALLVGLTVLPYEVIAQGLRARGPGA